MVCDWRALNKLTIKDNFAMPHPDMLFDKLKGAKYFTKLDLSQGVHQLRLTQRKTEPKVQSLLDMVILSGLWLPLGCPTFPQYFPELLVTYFGTIRTNS